MDTNEFDRIHTKLDVVVSTLEEIKITQAVQTHQLREYDRRSLLLETEVDAMKHHVASVKGAIKLVGFTSMLAGIATFFAKLGKFF